MQPTGPLPLWRALRAFTLVLLIAACACQKTAWSKVVSTDGSTIIGELVESRPDAVVVRTHDGRQITILRSRIQSVDTPTAADFAAGTGTAAPAASTAVPAAASPSTTTVPAPPAITPAPIVPSSSRSPRSGNPTSTAAHGVETPAPPAAEALSATGSPAATLSPATPAPAAESAPRPAMVLTVRLDAALASGDSEVDDDVEATLVNPVIVDGRQLVPAGVTVKGTVVESGKNGEGKPQLAVRFVSIERGEDDTIPIQASIVRWSGSVQQVPAAEVQSSFMGKIKKGLGMNKSGMVTVVRQASVARGTPIEIALEAPLSAR